MLSYFSYPQSRSTYSEPDPATHYYNLAMQHQRQAEFALAKAQEARAREIRAARERQFLEAAYLDDLHRSSAYYPSQYERPSPFGIQQRSLEAALAERLQQERRLQALTHRREQVAQQQAKREAAFNDFLASSVAGLNPPREQTQTPRRTRAVRFAQAPSAPSEQNENINSAEDIIKALFSGFPKPQETPSAESNQPQKSERAPAPATKATESSNATTPPVAVNRIKVENFAESLWNAFNPGRSEEEKRELFKTFGIPVPPPNPTRPEQPKKEDAASSNVPQSLPTQTPSKPEPAESTEANATVTPGDRAAAISSISKLQAKFQAMQSGFEFPDHIDFDNTTFSDSGSHSDTESDHSTSSSAPSVSYTKRNKGLRAYEHSLNSLLTKIDEVESHGDAEVREVRRNLVKTVEAELEALDRKKVAAWLKHTEKDKGDTLEEKVHCESGPESEQPAPQVPSVPTSAQVNNTDAPISATASLPADLPPQSPDVTPDTQLQAPDVLDVLPEAVVDATPEVLVAHASPSSTSDDVPASAEVDASVGLMAGRAENDTVKVVSVDEADAPESTLVSGHSLVTPSNTTSPLTPPSPRASSFSTPTSTPTSRRRSVTIEEVEDDEFELV